ncbi:MAG: DUF512 domain-containing protein [Oscillospiraceae bacterium]|jgi:putative radical SAM enzyme (TIGR03279 family)|nr:DUF512 domain-containing protein [Oscillospiraceae bacterium]
MSVVISGVTARSHAQKAGVNAGERLIAINDNEIFDVLDYRFYETSACIKLKLESAAGEARIVTLNKGEYDPLGLEFDTYLMDSQRACRNKCVFCFIDQLPQGLRESLYFKDDDSRLSFLMGNYITLTNITHHEIERIIKMHISPINISVHTTNPDLRVRMMKNPHAGEVLSYISELAQAGIKLNCQLVLCPEWNDGEELKRSLKDLAALGAALESVAAVPVGLTRYREGLAPLRPFTSQEAAEVVKTIEEFGVREGIRFAYPADEFYLKANLPIPPAEFYGDFAQLENGVGLMADLADSFKLAVDEAEGDDKHRFLTIATGKSACKFLSKLIDYARQKWHNLECNVVGIENHFFGELIDVAGLLTGGDLIRGLKGLKLGSRLLIPAVMLRREGDMFLDDLTPQDVEKALGAPVKAVNIDGFALLEALINEP